MTQSSPTLLNNKLSLSVQGKLMLVGEWGILMDGNSCISLPTKGLSVSIQDAKEIAVSSSFFNGGEKTLKILEKEKTTSAIFITNAIKKSIELLHIKNIKIQPFHLSLTNDPATYIKSAGENLKIGIGSSACITVGIIRGILLFHKISLEVTDLFSSALEVHNNSQNAIGSGFDVAAAAAGQAIFYQKATDGSSAIIEPLSIPSWSLAIGFSGQSGHTPTLIETFNEAKKEQSKTVTKLQYQINQIVFAMKNAIRNKDLLSAMACIRENRILLQQLSAICNGKLETDTLSTMIHVAEQHGAAAKFSGAGGGDCVIALCPNENTKKQIYKDWYALGFTPLKTILELCPEQSTTK